MKTKVAAIAAMLLFALGAIVQIWLPRTGATVMLLSFLCAFAVVVLRQQAILRRISANERLIVQTQKTAANAKAETALYGKSILRRVKLLTDERPQYASPGASTVALERPEAPNSPPNPEAGRAATPDVSNPFTVETIESMLRPGRRLKVAGIYSPHLLHDVEHAHWNPGDVVASLERDRPEAILIDEAEVRSSPVWMSATTGTGTTLMKDILDGIRWAKPLQIPVYVLPTTLAPDVHSSVLYQSSVVRLPLNADDLEPAAGGPQTPLLQRLNELAADRSRGEA